MKGAMDALGADVRTELRLWNSEYGEGMMNGIGKGMCFLFVSQWGRNNNEKVT